MAEIAYPRVQLECPWCYQPAWLSIKQVNKRVACAHCQAEFTASPDKNEMAVKPPPDRRYVQMICNNTKQRFQLVFERTNPMALYTLVKRGFDLPSVSEPASPSTPPPLELFDQREMNFTGFICEGCGEDSYSQSCCKAMFCAARREYKEDGKWDYCPICGRYALYDQPMVRLRGSTNRLPPPPEKPVIPASHQLGASNGVIRK
jgi:hypothetical protein